MSLQNNAPAPLSDPIARPRRAQYKGENRDPQEGLISDAWTDYFTAQSNVIEKMPARVASVHLADQGAAIGATDISDGTLTAGLYRVTYYMRISQPEGFGATTDVAIDWQDRGITRTHTSVTLDSTSDANYVGDTFLIDIDSQTPVRYTTTYNAVGSLLYDLDIIIEEVKA